MIAITLANTETAGQGDAPRLAASQLACPVTVVWARDAAGILLVDEQRGETRLLWGLECAVWNWLSLGYSYSELVEFMAVLLGITRSEAAMRLDDVLAGWVRGGWLEIKEPAIG